EGDFATIAQARGRCRSFGMTSGSSAAMSNSLIDVGDLARRVRKSHPDEAAAIAEALEGAVIANSTNLSGAHGISMYFPVAYYMDEVAAPTESFARMLAKYAEQSSSALEQDWAIPEFEHSGHVWTLELEPSQLRNLATASYTILGDYRGRGYYPIMSDVQILPNRKGVLHIPDDPETIVTGGDQSAIVPLIQVDASSERQVFRCDGSYVLPGADFVGAPNGKKDITLLLAEDDKGTVEVSSAFYQNDDIAVGGRANVNLLGYKTLMLDYGGWDYPDRADDGTMLPYAKWAKHKGRYARNEISLHEDIAFETCKASELPNDCVIQVVLTDITGEQHASELLPINRTEKKTAKVKTDNGKLEFVLEDGYAVLEDYSGEDEVLKVPAKVKGRPVTKIADDALCYVRNLKELTLPSTVKEIGAGAISAYNLERIDLGTGVERIGDGALSNCLRLEAIDLPEGLRSIGVGAFRSLGVAELRLPASLRYVGEAAFTSCGNLTAFEVADGCKAVSVKDGVLFSEDKKKLIAFPGGRTGAYKAPKGTEAVGYGAFASTKLESVVLPEGVKSIDNCAFYLGWANENNLSGISLPDSLESIGAYAFGTTYRGSQFGEAAPYISELRLGKNVRSIGAEAFGGLRVGRFIVDQSNETFSSPDGFLANKAGDTIVEVPGGLGELIVIPDGITTIGENAFSLYPAGTQLVFPNSVTRISTLAFPCHYVNLSVSPEAYRVYDVVFHCEKGSAAAKFAEKYGITWDETVDPAMLRYTEQLVEDEGLQMSFLVYPDHAVLHGIKITERAPNMPLVIPAQVGGSPVTAIDSMPGTNLSLDAWESVTLPATLESIDYQAIPNMRSIAGFSIEGENKKFTVKEGVLFSADERELVAFSLCRPRSGGGDPFAYEVPDGTRTIGKGAFFGSSLEAVSLPKSTRVLAAFSFHANYHLTDLRLNEGLERIESQAIYCKATSVSLPTTLKHIGDNALHFEGYEGFTLPERLSNIGAFNLGGGYNELIDIGTDTLHIGYRLTTLGQSALASVNVRAFEVDPYNGEFSSIDGLLMSKDGKTLIMCPAGRTGALRIPEGVEYLESGCLDEARGLTDVYFPDGVMGVDAYLDASSLVSVSGKVTFHCKKGSPAARYAAQWDISWVDDESAK
ncbi:MAG: leucine-rich repeat domain-containing protein, partial [Coriobacteriia bacterium]|nr:leucine-rich repeat domain-containing protein [Coriobacteriia bacterium]